MNTTAKKLLSSCVHVRGRFHRSVQLRDDYSAAERPQKDGTTVVGHDYLLTPTAADLARRVCDGLLTPGGTRAWAVIGPFGGGKSAFVLHLANLLSKRSESPNAGLRDAAKRLPRFRVIPVVGQRRSLREALAAALAEATSDLRDKPLAAGLRRRLRDPGPDELLESFQAFAEALGGPNRGGLMVAIDEFGKFVEHAVREPDADDVFLIQGLAELAARSRVPFLLMTVQHASLTQYLPPDDVVRRSEWAKVQGRLQEVTFLEPPEQMLRLVAAALDVADAGVRGRMERAVKMCLKDGAVRTSVSAVGGQPLLALLPQCVPLHPMTTLLLWPTFRSELAQNERSLFAFLSTAEPHGLRQFLRGRGSDAVGRDLLYGLVELFDYLVASLGGGLYRGAAGRRWAEVARVLERVGEADSAQVAVVKVVALLQMHGDKVGLRADEPTLLTALPLPGGVVKRAVASLQERSILVWRRHRKAFALWEGSDVDVDSLFEQELARVGRPDLPALLERHAGPDAIVALRTLLPHWHAASVPRPRCRRRRGCRHRRDAAQGRQRRRGDLRPQPRRTGA